MPDITEYKCPACGGAMEFDSKSQHMKCPYCDTELTLEEFQKLQKEEKQENANANAEAENGISDSSEEFWQATGDGQWGAGETDGMKVYVCESCGGEIIADDNTGATSCPYCGNKVVMKGQFQGDLKPDYVIPFKLDKKDAKAAYLKHLEGKPFLPPIFKNQNHIDEIKGMYVPFWLFDADADANITYDATKVRTWRSGNTEYTEHKYFNAYRTGSLSFDHIPCDGSKKMDDTLMESIEPYSFKDAVPFQPAYLAGYLADRYDVDMDERINRARTRIKKSAEDTFRKTVKGYSTVTTKSSTVHMANTRYSYALYPVWILNTTWNGRQFIFAMNGQTGKMVGDLPVDKKLYNKYLWSRTAIFSVVVYAIAWIIHLIL